MLREIMSSVKSTLVYAENRKPLRTDLIVFTSRNGKDFAGNMLRLLIELNKRYGDKYQYVIGLEKQQFVRTRKILKQYGLTKVAIVRYDSLRFQKLLQRASYLFNDTTFHMRYVKRPGQTYINTWHGTPLKKMGNDSPSVFAGNTIRMDNVQRNLFAADYLIFPSDYCQKKMTSAFCMNGLYKGTIIKEGYPRNSIFFDEESRRQVKLKFGLENKKVYVYMPTFREGENGDVAYDDFFQSLDEGLKNDEVLFVKLHYYDAAKVRLDKFKHIFLYPNDIETYEFLNIADTLISDYSSVIYDFAVTRKKIIRFAFDTEKYAKSRGLYSQPISFPFPVVESCEALLDELHSPKQYSDEEFINTYCSYEGPETPSKIIRHIFEHEKCCDTNLIYDQEREKVLFFAGALCLNGITTSAQNYLSMRKDERLYFISYTRKMLEKNTGNLRNLPKGNGVVEFSGFYYSTLWETAAFLLYYLCKLDLAVLRKTIYKFYRREAQRTFSGMGFDHYIHFDGYGTYVTGLLQHCSGRRIIFVHNDMLREIKRKKNQNILCIRDAYRSYDVVAVVAESLKARIARISRRKDNIRVVQNCQNDKQMKLDGSRDIVLQDSTRVFNVTGLSIEQFLTSHKYIFITIGRFSPEKRHSMLIDAFEKLGENQVGLIIIGGVGELYEQTCMAVEHSIKANDIMLIHSIENPMPILKCADLFILASEYEGMPMVFYEAECMGVPSIAVDTTGSHEFMEKYHGTLVEDSVDGLVKGMKLFLEGKIHTLGIDFEKYNSLVLRQYEDIFRS